MEWILFSFIQLLLPLLIIGGIVAAVVAWRRREGGLEEETETDRGIGRVKRLYFYAATFAYLIVASVGVVLVGRYLLDELFGPAVLSRDQTQLALGVALAVIWTPMWAWHRLRVQRFPEEEPAERRSILRKLYVYLTLGVTAALVAHASVELLRWIFGARSFGGYPVAALMVWAAVWLFHWVTESVEGQPTDETRRVRRLYIYVTAAYSLTMVAVGLGFAVYFVLREAYEGLFSVPVVLQGEGALWNDAMRNSLSVVLVGAGLWAWHWLYAARVNGESTLRQFYSYAFILGGVITTLVGTGLLVFGVLEWLIGVPEEESAAAHFRFLPGALSPLVIGLCLWPYHWIVMQRERAAAGELLAARRIYAYIMAALGMGALVAAIIVLVPTVIAIGITSARAVLAGPDWWRDRMVLFVTLALLGSPIWVYYWFSMQRWAARGGPEERVSLPRRVLVYGALGAGSLAIIGNISYLLFVLLEAVLEDTLSLTLLREAKWSIGVLTAAVLFVPYYWLVLREDRLLAAGEPVASPVVPHKSVTLLIGEDGGPLVRALEGLLGGKVQVLHRLDPDVGLPELSGEDLQGLACRVAEAVGSRVLLVADATGVQVCSYR